MITCKNNNKSIYEKAEIRKRSDNEEKKDKIWIFFVFRLYYLL